MAMKIEKVEHSVNHLSHVLDFKFAHLKRQLDTVTGLLRQGARVGEDAAVTSKLPPLPSVPGADKLPSVPGVYRLPSVPGVHRKKHKLRGLQAYRAMMIARKLSPEEDKHTSTTNGKTSW